jgi:7,8-dihydropterin-6-yl-methyl-4-(beta-D-ribofuranosyl)aminobenzene 5'-phosphate synthase
VLKRLVETIAVIKLIYNDVSSDAGLIPAWGFSALIEAQGDQLLFDTGGDQEIFAQNAVAMSLGPEQIDHIMISHDHWDHQSSLPMVLRPKQKVYILSSFSKRLNQEINNAGAEALAVDGFCKILPDVYTTGALSGRTNEQSLILDASPGLVIVTGCSHPGIVEIVRYVKNKLDRKISFLIGGFHLYEADSNKVRRIIKQLKDLGVLKVAPCHCTGEKAIDLFQEEFKNDFIKVGAGSIIDTEKL